MYVFSRGANVYEQGIQKGQKSKDVDWRNYYDEAKTGGRGKDVRDAWRLGPRRVAVTDRCVFSPVTDGKEDGKRVGETSGFRYEEEEEEEEGKGAFGRQRKIRASSGGMTLTSTPFIQTKDGKKKKEGKKKKDGKKGSKKKEGKKKDGKRKKKKKK